MAHGSESFVGVVHLRRYVLYTYSSGGTSLECALVPQYCWQYAQIIVARVLWVWYIHGGTAYNIKEWYSSSALIVGIQ